MKNLKLLRVDEAALRLRIKPSTIRKKILDRTIDYVKIGGAVRIPEEAVEKIVIDGYRQAISS